MGTVSTGALLLLSVAVADQGPTPEAGSQPAAGEKPEQTETIIVTGTRIVTPNRKSASPVETVRTEDFTLTGVPNVEQTLNQLPQIGPSFTTTSNNPGTGAATLDLRGLGSVRTLILVNGRRWIANDAGQVPEIDVNTIPAALINRVDIVTGGASAVYGSDAVTGVINFILKPKLDGFHLEARQNLTERPDASVASADLSYGTAFLDGRGNLLASVGWLQQKPVLQASREHTQFALSDGCVIPGTERAEDGSSEPAPDPDFDCSDSGEEFGLIRAGSPTIPAGRIATRVLFPTGVAGSLRPVAGPRFTPDGSLVPFNFATDAFNFAPDNYLQVPLQRISGNVTGSMRLSDGFEPYSELSFIRTRSPQQLAPALGRIGGAGTVPLFRLNLDNPFLSDQARQILELNFGRDAAGRRGFIQSGPVSSINPAFGGDADGFILLPPNAAFATRLTGLGPRRLESERNAYRGLAGVRGTLTGELDYDLFYSRSYVKHDRPLANSASASRLQQAILARRDPSGRIVCIDPSGGCVPVNLFGVQDVSPEAAAFIRADVREQTIVEEQVAEAVVKGPLWQLPAGPMRTAFGLHWRATSFDFQPDRSLELGDNLGFNPAIGASGKSQVFEGFAEVLVPLLSARPLAEDLSAELGARYSHYDTVGGVLTWKALGSWSPIRAFRLRGGMQKAVRAPNVRELFAEEVTSFIGFADPCQPLLGFIENPAIAAGCAAIGAGNVPPAPPSGATFGTLTTGGSQDLDAETARTLTVGAAIQASPQLAITLDYYDIDIRKAIGQFGGGLDFALFGCVLSADPSGELCQAITRDEEGTITSAFLPTANLARLRASGVDWQIRYSVLVGPGDLRLNLSGTRSLRSEIVPNQGIGAIDCAGYFGAPCGGTLLGAATPRWKLYNRLAYAAGPVTLSVRHRYFSSTRDARSARSEALGLPAEQIPRIAARLDARHYFDAAATFGIAKRFDLTLGVNNVTDAKPSLVGNQQVQANTDPSLYDMLGRRFFAALTARLP